MYGIFHSRLSSTVYFLIEKKHVHLFAENKKDESIVRVACQPTNGTESLLEEFYAPAKELIEHDLDDYCEKVLLKKQNSTDDDDEIVNRNMFGGKFSEIRDYVQDRFHGDDDDEKDFKVLSIKQTDFTQCKIENGADVDCDGCNIRFYHSKSFLSDETFAPSAHHGETALVLY